MQAIEFEATASQHTIRVPDKVPEGVAVRVLILFDDPTISADTGQQWKSLLAAMPDVGSDEDYSRPLDFGREQEWDS